MRTHLPALQILCLPLAAGCASILPQYEEAMAAALADPGPVPASWRPDAVLQLSPALLDEVVEAMVEEQGALAGSVDAGVASLKPRLEVKELELGPGKRCGDCVSVSVRLAGSVQARMLGATTRAPVKARGTFEAALSASPNGGDDTGVWTVGATLRSLRSVHVEVAGLGAGFDSVDDALSSWIEEAFIRNVPPQDVAVLGTSELPLRAARVVGDGDSVRVELLTASPTPQPLERVPTAPRVGWQLTVAEDALLDHARAEAFRAGPVAFDVVPEPTSLAVGPDRFELGLRLWRIKGRGWWRDYDVTGGVTLQRDRLVLEAGDVTEGPHSEGAALVDPLAALAEGAILRAVADAVAATVPREADARVAGRRAQVSVDGLADAPGAVVATGALSLSAPSKGKGRRRP